MRCHASTLHASRITRSRLLTFVIWLKFSSVTILMKVDGSNFPVVLYYAVQGD